jgi:hypothetical protein
MKKFFLKLWESRVIDSIRLWWISDEIDSLKEEFEDEDSSHRREKLQLKINSFSKEHNKVLNRVNERRAKHYRAIAR